MEKIPWVHRLQHFSSYVDLENEKRSDYMNDEEEYLNTILEVMRNSAPGFDIC